MPAASMCRSPASSDYFTVSLSCLQENFPEAVSLLARMLRRPRFAADKLDEVKVKLASAISRRNDSPDRSATGNSAA